VCLWCLTLFVLFAGWDFFSRGILVQVWCLSTLEKLSCVETNSERERKPLFCLFSFSLCKIFDFLFSSASVLCNGCWRSLVSKCAKQSPSTCLRQRRIRVSGYLAGRFRCRNVRFRPTLDPRYILLYCSPRYILVHIFMNSVFLCFYSLFV